MPLTGSGSVGDSLPHRTAQALPHQVWAWQLVHRLSTPGQKLIEAHISQCMTEAPWTCSVREAFHQECTRSSITSSAEEQISPQDSC